jgi:2-oxoisovalerate dehydrogenase E1 component beta subunit
VFKLTEGLFDKFGPERVRDTPISEQAIVGAAMGAAMTGLRPIAELMFSDFFAVAWDMVANQIAKTRYMTDGQVSLPLVLRTANGAGLRFGAQHSQSVENWAMAIPGLKVVAPSTPYDAKGLLKAAIRDPDPVIYFEHKKAYRMLKDELPDGDYTVPIGKAELRRTGDDITVISYGLMAHECLQAANALVAEGIETTVLDLRTLAPLDRDAILDAARRTGKILIVHEDNLTGGLGAEIAAIIVEHAFDALDAPVRRLAAPDVPAMPFNEGMEEYCLPSREKIATTMRDLAAY